jgi:hypothetical protein
MEKIKSFFSNDIVKTGLWIGVSAMITAVASYLLQKPELAAYYGVLNFVLYTIKTVNDKRKENK